MRSAFTWRGTCRKVRFVLAIVFLGGWAATAAAQGATPTEGKQVITAEGRAAILNDDVATARDAAINDARRQALEQAFGAYVDADTVVQNTQVLSAVVRVKSSGMIGDCVVTSEGREGDLYRVAVTAIVSPQDLERELSDLLSETSLLVKVEARIENRPADGGVLEEALVRQLVDAGYRVIDAEQAAQLREIDAEQLQGNSLAGKRLANHFLANLLVVGKVTAKTSQQAAQDFYFARTSITVRVVEATSGRVVFSEQVERLKSAGFSPENACEKGLQQAAHRIAPQVAARLKDHLDGKKRPVIIEARGVPSPAAAEQLVNECRLLRWVADASLESFDGDAHTATIRLDYAEKIVFLAAHFEKHAYALVNFAPNRILLEKK